MGLQNLNMQVKIFGGTFDVMKGQGNLEKCFINGKIKQHYLNSWN
jgi:hypothetical protein